ncbi:MAG: hypothetical protein JSR67_03770 [Proteobacteria bacterium]|nr:hypothetical protein [Pseudomonadota bacterium]
MTGTTVVQLAIAADLVLQVNKTGAILLFDPSSRIVRVLRTHGALSQDLRLRLTRNMPAVVEYLTAQAESGGG